MVPSIKYSNLEVKNHHCLNRKTIINRRNSTSGSFPTGWPIWHFFGLRPATEKCEQKWWFDSKISRSPKMQTWRLLFSYPCESWLSIGHVLGSALQMSWRTRSHSPTLCTLLMRCRFSAAGTWIFWATKTGWELACFQAVKKWGKLVFYGLRYEHFWNDPNLLLDWNLGFGSIRSKRT